MSESPSTDLSVFQRIIGEPGKVQHGGKCWHAKLTPEQQTEVDQAHVLGYTLVDISKVLEEEWGVIIGSKTVGSHYRPQGCSCKKRGLKESSVDK